MREMNLRDIIAMNVSHAIQGTIEHSDRGSTPMDKMEDYYQNRANWVNMATDNIIDAFVEFIPRPVDLEGKYEVGGKNGVYINIAANKSPNHNGEQLAFLARYSDDKGFNRYYDLLMFQLKSLYKTDTAKVK